MKVLITGGSGFIGSYLIDQLSKTDGNEIINLDIVRPAEIKHQHLWNEMNLLEKDRLVDLFKRFQPDWVVHLAARTDTNPESSLEDYVFNTEGTSNILTAIKECPSIDRVIITSTQFVHQRKGMPMHDEDFAPHTVYGESKVITEKLTRQANLQCYWTIIRPTNIWGPRHPRYSKEFWYVLKKGRYIHPGKKPVIRSYGYVGTVVDQIIQILLKPASEIDQQVFYVGEEPINLYDWVNGFSVALRGKKVGTVPRFIVKSLALTGDLLTLFKIKFPITSSRYQSMTEDNPVPMEKTYKVLGIPKRSLQDGINETTNWLKSQSEFWK